MGLPGVRRLSGGVVPRLAMAVLLASALALALVAALGVAVLPGVPSLAVGAPGWLWAALAGVTALTLALPVLAASWVARPVARRLRLLRQEVDDLAGDGGVAVAEGSGDEVADLAAAVGRLAGEMGLARQRASAAERAQARLSASLARAEKHRPLVALSAAMARNETMDALLEQTPARVKELLRVGGVAVVVSTPGVPRVERVGVAGQVPALAAAVSSWAQPLMEELLGERAEPGAARGGRRRTALAGAIAHHSPLGPALVVALRGEGGQPLGLLVVGTGSGGARLSPQAREVARAVADMVAAAVQRLRRQEQLERGERVARQVAREAQDLQERYRSLLENASDALFIINPYDGRFLEANQMACRLTGYTQDELLSMGVTDLHGDENAPLARGRLEATVRQGSAIFDDLPIVRKDGARLEAQFSSNLLQLGDQQVVESIARDVTAERARQREVEALYRDVESKAERLALLGQLARGLSSNLEARGVLANAVAEMGRVVPCDATAMLLRDPSSGAFLAESAIVSGGMGPQVVGAVARGDFLLQAVEARSAVVLASLPAEGDGAVPELTGVGYRSALLVPVVTEGSVSAVLAAFSREPGAFTPHHAEAADELGAHLAVALRNARLFEELHETLGQLQAAQRVMIQNEKLAAIGELVAGVAHELNNPLTGVIGYSELLLMGQDLEERTREMLGRIAQEAQRAAKIVQNLLYVARRQGPQRSPVDLNEVVATLLELRGKDLASRRVRVATELAPGLPPIMADRDQLQSVLLNLVQNAEQSISQGSGRGAITVSTALQGGMVRVDVADDGPGIAPEHLTRVFDPFFTTKPPGQGTGLGLSICHGIVAGHGGQITVESVQGRGATFTVLLPLGSPVEEPAVPSSLPARRSRPAAAGSPASILVVDDEGMVVDLVTAVLRKAGYRATAFLTAEDAMASLDREPWDLVLLDLRMPGMDGRQLFTTLAQERPQVAERVVFVTGDMVTAATSEFLERAGRPVVTKPFQPDDLLAAVQRELALRRRRAGT